MVNRLSKQDLEPDLKKDLDDVFGALGAGVRRGILEHLRTGPLPVMSLAERFPVSWPAISKHLKVLEEAGLVERHVEGRTHRISLAPGALARASRWLDGFAPEPAPATGLPLDRARAHAVALLSTLAPALPVLRAAVWPERAQDLDVPAAMQAQGLARRLAASAELADEVTLGLAAAEALHERLASPLPLDLEALQAGTWGPSRLAFLLRHHPSLAAMGLTHAAAVR